MKRNTEFARVAMVVVAQFPAVAETNEAEPLVGLIFVGNSNSTIADELEADALKFGFEITDTIMDETNPVDMLKWYMKNTSIIAVLVRDICDISSDQKILMDVLKEAERQDVRIHSKSIGWNAVTAVPWDGDMGC